MRTLFPGAAAPAPAAVEPMLRHRRSDLARAMAEQRCGEQQAAISGDDEADDEGDTLEELDDASSGRSADGNDDDVDTIEATELPMNLYGEEDVSKMDIEEVRLRLAELENASGPTKAEIDAILAQYSDYSSGSESSGSRSGGGASSDNDDDDEHQETVIMKVLVVGNARCGKTSTIRRFVSKQFCESYVSTVGADFVEQTVEYDAQLKLSLQLWDIAGQDRFAKLTRAYFREAKGALIVCDITRENTVDAVMSWKNEIDVCAQDLNGGEPIPVVMVANKSDLLDDVAGALTIGASMQKCVAENGILEWFRTSAKSGDSVDAAFECLIDRMVANHRAQRSAPTASGDNGVASDGSRRIRLTSLPPLSYDNMGGFGCDCN